MRRKYLLLPILLLLNVTQIYAQRYNFKTYTVNDGLPSSQVYDVQIDNKGLVWFATGYGLAVFDGVEFNRYGREEGLSDELIYDIYEDSKDRFWVSTESGGVAQVMADSVVYLEDLNQLDSTQVLIMSESPQTKDLWFGTYDNGVFIWDGDEIENLTTTDGLPGNQVWEIVFSRNNSIWLATDGGVAVIERGKGVVKTWTKENGLSGNSALSLFESTNGEIWVATDNGATVIKDGKVQETILNVQGEPINSIYSIVEDSDGVIWMGTSRKGIYWYNDGEFEHITKDEGLSSNYIYKLIKARDGTIWIATEGNGVSILRGKGFKIYDRESDYQKKSAYSIALDNNGVIWSGNEQGLTKYEDGEFTHFDFPEHLSTAGEIWDIEQLPNGNLILLTYNYMILEFDGSKFHVSDYNKLSETYSIMDFEIGDDGTLWIAEFKELFKAKNGKVESVKKAEDDGDHLHMLFKDSRGRIWVGTEKGLVNVEDKDLFFSSEDGLAGSEVYDVSEDERGNLWVGTNEGVSVIQFREDNQKAEIANFKNEDVFQSETISLIHDRNGGLWQGTNSGLNYFDTETWYRSKEMNILYFSLSDYSRGLEFSGNATTLDNNGNIWFGSPESGLVQYSDHVEQLTVSSPLRSYIRRMYVNSTQVYDYLSDDKSLAFEHDENNVEFEFGALNYKDPFRIFFRYKLEGFDEEWHTNFADRKAVYTNLEPGKYTFSVMAKSTHSNWPTTATTLNFEIKSPFWLTTWFLLFSVALVITMIALGIKYYINYSERKKLKRLVDEQTLSLTNALSEKEILIKEIHHRVKNNLAVVSGLLDLQSWQMEDGDAKDALEDSKLRIRAMASIHEKLYQNTDLTKINISDFVVDLVDEISKSLKGNHKNIDVKMDIQVQYLPINHAIPCGLMLNELISNTYEHAFPESSSGNIIIVFKEQGDNFVLKVMDDGVGIPDSILEDGRTSLGITLIQSLSQQLNGELNFKSENGTIVTVVFPKSI